MSRLYPETSTREIGYQTSLHLNQWVLALTYRTSFGLAATDFGGHFAFLEREGTGSLKGLGVDVRQRLTPARGERVFPEVDLAAVVGVHLAGKDVLSADIERAALTVPLGVTLGRWLTERSRVFAHPRVEFTSQRNICDELRSERCVTRWLPKLEAGAQIRISPGVLFGGSVVTGDRRISRPGIALGANWVW